MQFLWHSDLGFSVTLKYCNTVDWFPLEFSLTQGNDPGMAGKITQVDGYSRACTRDLINPTVN